MSSDTSADPISLEIDRRYEELATRRSVHEISIAQQKPLLFEAGREHPPPDMPAAGYTAEVLLDPFLTLENVCSLCTHQRTVVPSAFSSLAKSLCTRQGGLCPF